MRVEGRDGKLVVFLSRRNLRALLAKLNDPTSVRTLEHWGGLSVVAEDDDVHYSHPSRRGAGPGEVLGRTLEAMVSIEHEEGVAPREDN